jgi:hypothetical protein
MAGDEKADDALLAELATALGPEMAPPPELVEAAKASFTWRTIDAELADLAHDSLVDLGVGVRAGASPRILTFESAALTIEVEVDETPGQRRLIGQLVPGGPADLELRTTGTPATGRADELGRFVLSLPAERCRASIRCMRPEGGAVESAWVVI